MSETASQVPYTGSCHCGQAKFSFTLSVPVEEQEVVQCNCSICQTNGYLLVYPQATDVTYHHSDDAVKSYVFATKQAPHYFCVNCGTSLYVKTNIQLPGANGAKHRYRLLEDQEGGRTESIGFTGSVGSRYMTADAAGFHCL